MIKDLPNLKDLTLSPCITGQGLRHVCEMRNLKSLSLRGNASIQPSDLANLAGSKIEALSVRAGFTGDGGLAHYRALQNLNALRLWHETTDADLAYLPRLPKLTHLYLSWSQVTDDGLKYLKRLPALEMLHLRSVAGIKGPGLRYLQELPSLKKLDLSHSNVGDEGLRNLAAVRSLEDLNLRKTAITDAGAVYAGRMLRLRKLDLSGNRQLTSEFLSKLSGLQELRELDLTYTSVDDAGMRHISKLTKLESLVLGDNRIRLFRRAAGEEIVITVRGRPTARLTCVVPKETQGVARKEWAVELAAAAEAARVGQPKSTPQPFWDDLREERV